MQHMQQYTQFRIPTDLHSKLKDLAHERRVSMTSLLAQAITLLDAADAASPKAKRDKTIQHMQHAADAHNAADAAPLTPATKKPFIIQPRKPTVPVYGDPSSDDYRPSWDDSETMS